MNNIKVSTIVAIYNNENFLERTLNSLINQTLKEIEIICINDGSTDGSLDILNSFSQNDFRIKIVNKSNTGYGDSLNCGLNMAQGEYIGSLDSDDFVRYEMFESLYRIAKTEDADLVKSRFYLYWNEKTKELQWRDFGIKNECINRLISITQHPEILFIPPSMWSAIYKKELIMENNIHFINTPGAAYQDTSFSFKTFAMAHKIYLVDSAFLYYCQDNENSSIKNVQEEKIYVLDQEFKEIEEYLVSKKRYRDFKDELHFCNLKGFLWNVKRMDENLIEEYILNRQVNYSHLFLKNKFESKYLSLKGACVLWCIRRQRMLGLKVYFYIRKMYRLWKIRDR